MDDDHKTEQEFCKALAKQSAEADRIERKTFRLSDRVAVTFIVGRGIMECLWDPRQPEQLTVEEAAIRQAASSEMLAVYISLSRIQEALSDEEIWRDG